MVPVDMRHRFRNVGTTEARLVFHLGPLAPRPELGHVDTEEPRAERQDRRSRPGAAPMSRRVAVTGIGVVAPGGDRRAGLLGPADRGPHRDPRHHAASTRGLPLPDRRRVRLRPARLRARRRGDRTRRPVRPVRAGRRGRGDPRQRASTSPRRDPWRLGVSLGTAVGGTTRLEHDYVAVSAGGSRWDVDHRAGRAAPVPGVRAQHAGRRGGRATSAPRARCRRSRPAAPPGWTPSATPSS